VKQINGTALVCRQLIAGASEIPGWGYGKPGDRVKLWAHGYPKPYELILELGEEFPEPHCATRVTLIEESND
jgi:hypothetical protein